MKLERDGFIFSVEKIEAQDGQTGYAIRCEPKRPHGYAFSAFHSLSDAEEVCQRFATGRQDMQVFLNNFSNERPFRVITLEEAASFAGTRNVVS